MAKKLYAADGGRSRKIGKLYAAEDGAAQKIRKLYAVFGGVCRTVYLSAYRWAVYNSVGTTSWVKAEAVETTTYVWKKYGIKTTYGAWTLSYIEEVEYAIDSYSDADRMQFFSKLVFPSGEGSTYGAVSVDRDSYVCSGAENSFGSKPEIYNNVLAVDESGEEVHGVVLGAYGDKYAPGKWDYTIPEGWTYIEVTSDIRYDYATDQYVVKAHRYQKAATRSRTEEADTAGGYTEVSSANRGQYPDNGKSGGSWTVYDRKETGWAEGAGVGEVSSTDGNAYPANGRGGDGYWYRRTGITYSRGNTLLGEKESENINAYPENGRHKDGLWYVRED